MQCLRPGAFLDLSATCDGISRELGVKGLGLGSDYTHHVRTCPLFGNSDICKPACLGNKKSIRRVCRKASRLLTWQLFSFDFRVTGC